MKTAGMKTVFGFVVALLVASSAVAGGQRGIVEIKPLTFSVDRAALAAELVTPRPRGGSLLSALSRSARIVPELREGKAVGFRLYSVKADGLLGRLGFANGDRVLSVNQLPLSSPEQAEQAHAALSRAERLDVRLERGGKEIGLTYILR